MISNDILSVLLIALGLSADCFVVALGGGISKTNHSWPRLLRVSFSFGVFQALMPVLGWLAGRTVVELIADYDHWVAFAMLAIVSGRMLWGAFHSERSQGKEIDITRGLLLITLSIATSIDALAVGLSFALLNINIALASTTIGVVAFVVTVIGFKLGKRASNLVGKRAEAIGGIILLAIGLRILLSHILQ
jgi:putative Mn2+ efflux pump MntP